MRLLIPQRGPLSTKIFTADFRPSGFREKPETRPIRTPRAHPLKTLDIQNAATLAFGIKNSETLEWRFVRRHLRRYLQ